MRQTCPPLVVFNIRFVPFDDNIIFLKIFEQNDTCIAFKGFPSTPKSVTKGKGNLSQGFSKNAESFVDLFRC